MVESSTTSKTHGPIPSAPVARAILRVDGLRLARDRLLVGISVYIVGVAVALRWLIPYAGSELEERFRFDLSPYDPLIVSTMILQFTPLVGGWVVGLLLLESKESRVIDAMRVTPVSVGSHVLVLCLVCGLACALLACFEGLVIGIGLPPVPTLIVSSVAIGPSAACIALFVSAIASTKTEAIAYGKFVGLLPWLSVISWFVPEPWQYLFGLYPAYWASKAYWLAVEGAGGWLGMACLGLGVSAAWIAVLARLCIPRLRA